VNASVNEACHPPTAISRGVDALILGSRSERIQGQKSRPISDLMPSAASAVAIAAPIPRAAPVTTATLFMVQLSQSDMTSRTM
jgi:hypothetical protein